MKTESPSDYDDRVRVIYHPAYTDDYVTASCETPDRVRSVVGALEDRFSILEPEPCTDDDIMLCHSEGLLLMEKTNTGRYETARLAAGGAIKAFDLSMDGYVSFAAVRPPGHHASPDLNWGFCFFNNIAIAVKKGLEEGRISSAVILDIDLHFGDGTDNIFAYDNRVQVINIQSSNPEDFIRETDGALEMIKKADMLAISAGFDQYEKDWGGNLSTPDYRKLGEISANFAREKTGGRLFAVLEGGYYIPDLGKNALALIEGMNSQP